MSETWSRDAEMQRMGAQTTRLDLILSEETDAEADLFMEGTSARTRSKRWKKSGKKYKRKTKLRVGGLMS